MARAPSARSRVALSTLSLGGVLLGPAVAAPAMAQGLDMSHGQQINVTAAGGFDWDQNAQTVTAYDRAQAIRGDVTVRADRLIAFYRKKAAAPAGSKGTTGATTTAGQPIAQPPGASAPLADHMGVAPPLETRRPHIVDDAPAPASTVQPPTAPAASVPADPDVDTSLATGSDTLPQDLPTPDSPTPAGAPGGPGTAGPSGNGSGGDSGPGGASEVYRLEALGHVHSFNMNDQAWGDRAVYDVDQAILVMTGQHLKMTTPQDILTARDVLEYHSHEHMSVARGNATMTTSDGRQIRADVLVGYDRPKDQRSHPRREWNDTHPDGKKDTPVDTADDRPAPGAGTIDHVDAFGHIVIRTRTETVTGDRGVYVPDTGIARLVGNVHITRGENQVSGTSAIVNMHTDIATLTDNPGSRVSGLVIPNQAGKGDKGSAR
ncbi:LptA/OstA family protein [Komagataeibacter sp. FNDCF1]|uniref:LptA/OstA family protein n=1 Tax=Komagataeibacter sp. FNDCF1 TaxID=2878681 RepID=UPI001E2D24C9|nr:LptA/OstA family protein [Komagataeibacter sp. FNDCF1]MCE2565962.1 LptA/OstA family protein [Komagataeibacter sp. FNDCF1]